MTLFCACDGSCSFGSVGVAILRNETDMLQLIGGSGLGALAAGAAGSSVPSSGGATATDAPLDLEIEKYIDGRMYHVDGLVLNGELKLCWPSRYVNAVANYNKNSFIAGVSLTATNPLLPRIQNFTKQCLEV